MAKIAKDRVKLIPSKNERKAVLEAISNVSTQPQFEIWLEELKEGLGISIPSRVYSKQKQRLLMIAALLPRKIIRVALGTRNPMPSWREMALIGDGLWSTYLRITFINKGLQNGQVTKKIGDSNMESREYLGEIGRRLNLQSYLPFTLEGPAPGLHPGELAETFLGWVYTYAGVEACFSLAKRYQDS